MTCGHWVDTQTVSCSREGFQSAVTPASLEWDAGVALEPESSAELVGSCVDGRCVALREMRLRHNVCRVVHQWRIGVHRLLR